MSDAVLYRRAPLADVPIRRIGGSDLRAALRAGLADFMAKPSHLIFLALIYPIAGVVLARMAFVNDLVPLLFPLVAGFAILGPVAAVATYEVSRRRERGLDTGFADLGRLARSPEARLIAEMAVVLLALFVAWLGAAEGLYRLTLGDAAPTTPAAFVHAVATTPAGWALVVAGNLVGFVFAAAAFTLSVVSFPLIVDRGVGLRTAVATSARCVAANPRVLAAWGALVALALALGMAALFVGLAVVLPVLGHASWHLYRRLIPDQG